MTIHFLAARLLTPYQLERLHTIVPDAEIVHFNAQSGQEIEQALTPVTEVLFTGRGDFSCERATGLRWVQMENAGIDHIHGTPLWQSTLPMASANGAHLPHLIDKPNKRWHKRRAGTPRAGLVARGVLPRICTLFICVISKVARQVS